MHASLSQSAITEALAKRMGPYMPLGCHEENRSKVIGTPALAHSIQVAIGGLNQASSGEHTDVLG